MTAVAMQAKQRKTRKALQIAVAGIVAIGFVGAAFTHFDAPSSVESTVGGTVTNTWRERGGFVYCQIRLADGVVINEQCDNFPVGAQITVERLRRPLTGRTTYGTVRRDK